MEKNVASLEKSVDRQQSELDEVKKNWFDPLQELVKKINNNFERFFKSINCAGTVTLDIPANRVRIFFIIYNLIEYLNLRVYFFITYFLIEYLN